LIAVLRQILFCAGMFRALKTGFRSLAILKTCNECRLQL